MLPELLIACPCSVSWPFKARQNGMEDWPHWPVLFLEDFLLEFRGFTAVIGQRDEKRTKENKKKKTKPFCTLVVARLSSSDLCHPPSVSWRAAPRAPVPLQLRGSIIPSQTGIQLVSE